MAGLFVPPFFIMLVIRYKPSKLARMLALQAAAYAAQGDLFAEETEGWRRAMAPTYWTLAGRWYRAALAAD